MDTSLPEPQHKDTKDKNNLYLSLGILEFTLLLLDPDDKLLPHLFLLLLQGGQVALATLRVLLREAAGLAFGVREAHL